LAQRRSVGVAGSAALVGAAGLYLVYVGVKDVPFFQGLSDIIRSTPPTPKKQHGAYVPKNPAYGTGTAKAAGTGAGDKGIDRLIGNAARAYPAMRQIAPGDILGWGLRPSGGSDHPRGLAMDVMTTDNTVAQNVIALFRNQTGAKYWIWNRQIANREVDNWRVRPYTGLSPHTDHVHLSYS
jgi:hypothetical protein